MKIQRPKKNANGTYEGAIFKNARKDEVTLYLSRAIVMDVKKTGASEYYMTLKPGDKESLKEVARLSAEVIAYVKENCALWFKNSLSDDLIEDYFTPNVVFDPEKGRVIRIKCTNDVSMLAPGTALNMVAALRRIRFYKQKFVVEWEVDEAEIIDKDVATQEGYDSDSDIEDPEPSAEELDALKKQYICESEKRLELLRGEMESLLEALDRLRHATTFPAVSAACDDLDKILE